MVDDSHAMIIWGIAAFWEMLPLVPYLVKYMPVFRANQWLVTVSAVEDTSVLFMNVGRVLTTCSKSCIFHTKLVQNLLTVCAYKSLQLSQRIQHTSLNLYVGD